LQPLADLRISAPANTEDDYKNRWTKLITQRYEGSKEGILGNKDAEGKSKISESKGHVLRSAAASIFDGKPPKLISLAYD